MAGYFEEKLLELLPPIYREMDTSGDLRAFLSIPAPTLDEIKNLIDQLPSIFDVDACEERFLPLLASLVGYQYDRLRDPKIQRREIKESVERHRRKGTIPAIIRSLENNGWRGQVTETYHQAIRLNRRGKLSGSRLPGRIYSLGVYRVESENVVPGIREILWGNHPAGMKVFFLQWLRALGLSAQEIEALVHTVVTTTFTTRKTDILSLNRSLLNSGAVLTTKERCWSYWRITDQAMVDQSLDQSQVRFVTEYRPYLGRSLNHFTLNSRHLPLAELNQEWEPQTHEFIAI